MTTATIPLGVRHIQVRVSDDLYERFRKQSYERRTSLQQLALVALTEYMERLEASEER